MIMKCWNCWKSWSSNVNTLVKLLTKIAFAEGKSNFFGQFFSPVHHKKFPISKKTFQYPTYFID